MPRRVLPPTLVAPPAPAPPSAIVQRLRQDWRWAGVSQFIWTFADAFGLLDWDIEALESDLDGTETEVLPDVLAKLLYALTWNRQINRDNVFEHVRKQYLKRDPDNSPMGTIEEPVEWAALGLGQKVQILWQLCEWQLVDPARFRSLLKSEDDATSWRVDPIGWDKNGNTYFLFDDNRLWVQRARPVPPRPQKKTSLKAKRSQRAIRRAKPPAKRSHKRQEASSNTPRAVAPETPEPPVSGPRKRTQVKFYGNVTPTVEALKRGGVSEPTPKSDRATRSSARNRGEPSPDSKSTPLPRGTRLSRRLHALEDDWQQVPEDWLEGSSGGKNKAAKQKAKAGDDDDSELSDLTDEEEHQAELKATLEPASSPPSKRDESPLSDAPEEAAESPEEAATSPATPAPKVEEPSDDEYDEEDEEPEEDVDEVALAVKEAADLPEGFIEWETVCVTLYEWRTVPEQWAKSRDPDERALYKLLANDVAPQIIEVLIAKEQERLKQEAIVNRKRSSRIATRELAREEQLKHEAAQREMEERMERSRREEARREREEIESKARENRREYRLREREERLLAREQAAVERAETEARDSEQPEPSGQAGQPEQPERRSERRKRPRIAYEEASSSYASSPVQTPRQEPSREASSQPPWELNCEVCKQQGWNLSDDADIVCCDDCGRWQHVKCHDRQDIAAGRGIRDWDKVDFRCKECEVRAAKHQRAQAPSNNGPAAPQVSIRPPYPMYAHNGHAQGGQPLPMHSGRPIPMQQAFRPPQNASSVNGHHPPPQREAYPHMVMSAAIPAGTPPRLPHPGPQMPQQHYRPPGHQVHAQMPQPHPQIAHQQSPGQPYLPHGYPRPVHPQRTDGYSMSPSAYPPHAHSNGHPPQQYPSFAQAQAYPSAAQGMPSGPPRPFYPAQGYAPSGLPAGNAPYHFDKQQAAHRTDHVAPPGGQSHQ